MKPTKLLSNLICLIALFAVLSSFIFPSYKQTTVDNIETGVKIMAPLDSTFIEDEDFVKLWDITVDIWTRFANHSIDSVCDATDKKDTLGVIAFSDFTSTELEALVDTLEAIADRLVKEYPELKDIADTTDCYCGEPGHSELRFAPICEYLEYLDENEYIEDLESYFYDIYAAGGQGGNPPDWAICLAVCIQMCLPLGWNPPAYLLCMIACEAACLLMIPD